MEKYVNLKVNNIIFTRMSIYTQKQVQPVLYKWKSFEFLFYWKGNFFINVCGLSSLLRS